MTSAQPPAASGPPPRRRRKPAGHRGPNLRAIDKPLLESFGPKRHANRDFVTARVARNRRRLRRILFWLLLVLIVGGAAAWWRLSGSVTFAVSTLPSHARIAVVQSP